MADLFSKYTFIYPLMDKTGETVKNVLSSIFQTRKPLKISSDNGTEFKNAIVMNFLKEQKVNQVFSLPYHSTTQGQVERRNQDIKNIIFKHFIETKTYRYIDILDNIKTNINENTINSTTKMTPPKIVENKDNEDLERIITENIKEKAEKPKKPKKSIKQRIPE